MRRTKYKLSALVLSISLLVPFTSYAGQWVQDNAGWKVQNDDGSYITNSWYQSPESGLFYYLGADSYMMVDTTTPDGYQVGPDGVWIESQPQVTPTQSQQQPSQSQQQAQISRTPEEQAQLDELNRLIEERGKRQTDTNIHLEPGDAKNDLS